MNAAARSRLPWRAAHPRARRGRRGRGRRGASRRRGTPTPQRPAGRRGSRRRSPDSTTHRRTGRGGAPRTSRGRASSRARQPSASAAALHAARKRRSGAAECFASSSSGSASPTVGPGRCEPGAKRYSQPVDGEDDGQAGRQGATRAAMRAKPARHCSPVRDAPTPRAARRQPGRARSPSCARRERAGSGG